MNNLTSQLIAELCKQESGDPFLTLVTLSHSSFGSIRLVNNSEAIVSRGNTFVPFPLRLRLPSDDGETSREFSIEFDNVSLYLLEQIRTVTDAIDCKLELILASIPDDVQIVQEDLKLVQVTYNAMMISGVLVLDNFLNSEMPGEKYQPSNFPGLF